jgi:uncharacterized protein (DUF697 family)/GTP-binding protein EngB required for normal cell division
MQEFSPEAVNNEVAKLQASMKVPNILICGQTGAGKSSAVNFIFKDNAAPTSDSEPCSRDVVRYFGPNINIYDSEGYEIGDEKQAHYRNMLLDDFLLKVKGGNAEDEVHLVWYTISAAGKRYTSLDVALVKEITNAGYNVCVLLTKIDELSEDELTDLHKSLSGEFLGKKIFRLSTNKDAGIQSFCDWDALITWSYEMLPNIFRERYVSGLRAGLGEKHKQADIAVGMAVTAAAAVGVSPIPFSDAALLVPIQTGMVMRVLSLYGIKLADGAIASLISSTTVSALGKSVAGNLVKLIPGVGSVMGAVINASVAAAITGAIGKTLTELCQKQAKDMLEGKQGIFNIETIFSSTAFINSIKQNFIEDKR